ncbi:MAG TPA: molybdate ABC transporter substrate-binding protein [Rhizomicrobium sp.]|nr:molybdate ABC transporter substrate-binding protein [Rhizomicrobium sp.]
MKPITLACTLVSALFLSLAPVRAADVTVFAAASLSDVLQDIGKSYEAQTKQKVVISFAASSALAKQIEAAAGADVFISADTDWMNYLDTRGRLLPGSRKNLLSNTLVLIAPVDSGAPLLEVRDLFKLHDALHGGRLALADPDSVPAGKYARSALEALGVWPSVKGRLANAENVRVALAYVARKEAPLGIVYRTDALSEPKVKVIGTIPANTHPPIIYPAALTRDAKPAAKAFLAYLSGKTARAAFKKAGFIVLNTP